MGKFLCKSALFFLVVGVIMLMIISYYSNRVDRYHFYNWETESNLLHLKSNQHYDMLIMGISHARNLSRHRNHLKTERILNKKVVNIGRGLGKAGASIQLLYLRQFYAMNNKADIVLYVMTPPMMFSDRDKQSTAFNDEPFKPGFLMRLFMSKVPDKWNKTFYYLESKTKKEWLNILPYSEEIMDRQLNKIDTLAINEGLKAAYPIGLDQHMFEKNAITVTHTVKLCKRKNARIIFVITPTLFGSWPGHQQVIQFLARLNKEFGVVIYDFSSAFSDPSLFYDHHHLNSKGVEIFLEDCLKPLLP